MIYRPEHVKVLFSAPVRIRFPFDTTVRTRDILYVKALLTVDDTIHVFINHWPSRRGGAAESAPRRNYVASVLKSKTDSILSAGPLSSIIIMGDFNDEPENESLNKVLQAEKDTNAPQGGSLINLMSSKLPDMKIGTIKYQGRWSVFDQFIASGSMVRSKSGLSTSAENAHIFHSGFLLDDDTKFLGSKLKRTYTGPKYTAGFSDHLPVYLDVWENVR